MRGLKSMCKIKPDSAACNNWKREMCGQCPDWKPYQDQGHSSSSSSSSRHKLMTTDECHRLKRELQATLFAENRGINPMTFLLLMFSLVFCIALTCCLLAKAFVFKKPSKVPGGLIEVCQDRQSGGHASAEEIMQKLRDKCKTSARRSNGGASDADELYVPPKFWDSFQMKGFAGNPQKTKQKNGSDSESGRDDELETEESESDQESSESLTTELSNDSDDRASDEASSEGTTSSTGEQTERSTADEDQTSITMDIQQAARKCTDAIGKMPTCYGSTTTNPSNRPNRSRIRWANWLRRSKQNDFEA